MISRYDQLEVWQLGMELVVECYRVSKGFPSSEQYGLCGQMQRAAISIPANIAEGFGRQHRGEFLHHLAYAYGSLMQLETHVQIARRLNFIDNANFEKLMNLCRTEGRMLNKLQASLAAKSRNRTMSGRKASTEHRAPSTEH